MLTLAGSSFFSLQYTMAYELLLTTLMVLLSVILACVLLGMELKPSFVVLPTPTTGEIFLFQYCFWPLCELAGLLILRHKILLTNLRLTADVHVSLFFFLRSVQREPITDAFLSEIYSWFLCRESSNTTCCYRCVYVCIWIALSHLFSASFIQQQWFDAFFCVCRNWWNTPLTQQTKKTYAQLLMPWE